MPFEFVLLLLRQALSASVLFDLLDLCSQQVLVVAVLLRCWQLPEPNKLVVVVCFPWLWLGASWHDQLVLAL